MGAVFDDGSKAAGAAAKALAAAALAESAALLRDEAARRCPVDTGRLRGSIAYKLDIRRNEAVVGTNVEYASDVEYGTKFHPKPQPFMRGGAEAARPKIARIFRRVLGGGARVDKVERTTWD